MKFIVLPTKENNKPCPTKCPKLVFYISPMMMP